MATTIKKKKIEDKPTTPQFINPEKANKIGYGVRTPEGKDITGLTADQAFSLQTGYKKPKLSEDEQIKADYERNQKAEAYAKSQEPTITPELASGVGQINPDIINEVDPLTQDIAANLQGQQTINAGLDYSGTAMENLYGNAQVVGSKVLGLPIKILNRVFKDAKLGNEVANMLSSNDEINKVIKGFNTIDNVKQVRENLDRAEALKATAFEQAKTDPITAKQNYELYLSLKMKALMQMKALSRDPNQFIELRAEIQLLTDYFDESKGIKVLDDNALLTALNMG